MSAHSLSVLIVRLDAIGDAVTLAPLIAALRSRGARIGAVLSRTNAQVFSERALDRRHVWSGNARALAAEIEARRYEYALIVTEKPAGYRIASLARVPNRIGFENGWGKPLKTLWVRRTCTQTVFRTAGLDARAPHECTVVFSLAEPLLGNALPSRDPRMLSGLILAEPPQPDPRIAFQVTEKWLRLGASFDDVLRLARAVREHRDVRWVASATERDFGNRFAAALDAPIERFESVPSWKQAIGAARAIVAPDSGATQIAGMTGTPVVACFARQHFERQTARWSPWAAPCAVVPIDGAWTSAAADALDEVLSGSPSPAYRG